MVMAEEFKLLSPIIITYRSLALNKAHGALSSLLFIYFILCSVLFHCTFISEGYTNPFCRLFFKTLAVSSNKVSVTHNLEDTEVY